MTAVVVLGLVATVLTGVAGTTVDATVLAYSAAPQNITIGDRTVEIGASVASIRVPLAVEHGKSVQRIAVETETLTYELPVTVIGKRDAQWLWWLLALPVTLIFCAVRLRRDAGSS